MPLLRQHLLNHSLTHLPRPRRIVCEQSPLRPSRRQKPFSCTIFMFVTFREIDNVIIPNYTSPLSSGSKQRHLLLWNLFLRQFNLPIMNIVFSLIRRRSNIILNRLLLFLFRDMYERIENDSSSVNVFNFISLLKLKSLKEHNYPRLKNSLSTRIIKFRTPRSLSYSPSW